MNANSANSTAPANAPCDVMRDEASPVFLVGATRSGTTLLRLMLNHHPQICNFGEFEYAVRWYDGDQPPSLARYQRQLELDRVFRVHGWKIDPQLDYVHLVRSFLQQAVDASGKPIAGATVHSRFDCLPTLWPQARYLHLVRDPRDVSRSAIQMGWVGNVWFGTEYWRDPIMRWQRLQRNLAPDRWLQIRFEDLIQDTKRELRRICDFLGVPYSSAMLQYADETTYELPDPRLVNQWRKKLTNDELQWVESECHELMREFGYEPVSAKLSPPGPVTALRLSTQHRLSRIRRNIGRYGLPLYVQWQIAKRMPHSSWKKQVLQAVDEVDILPPEVRVPD